MKNPHAKCRHCPLGTGVVYCDRTRLVYLRPDLLPWPGKRPRGKDDIDLAAHVIRRLTRSVWWSRLEVNGIVLVPKQFGLPNGPNDLPGILEMLRALDSRPTTEGE